MRKMLAMVLIAALVVSMIPLLESAVITADSLPRPEIVGVDPTEPLGWHIHTTGCLEWLGILGTGFVPDSQVILHSPTRPHTIPAERTEYQDASRINVFVGLYAAGTWTAQVVNPDGQESDRFPFQVRTPGRYHTSWDEAGEKGWYSPLGSSTVHETSNWFDFDSHGYICNHKMRHAGLDFMTDIIGTPVYSIADGTVQLIHGSGTNQRIWIEHETIGGSFFAVYGHIAVSQTLKDEHDPPDNKATVKSGQEIGKVLEYWWWDKDGNPHANHHLHFGINVLNWTQIQKNCASPNNWGQTVPETNPRDYGWRDPIAYLESYEVKRPGSRPAQVDVVLVIDDSGSMSWNDPSYMRRQAAEVFINAMQPEDRIGIVAFTGSATPLWSIQPVGADRQPAIDSLKALRSSGGTSLSAGLLAAYAQLESVESSGNRKAVVFLTDGVGTYNNEALMFGTKNWPVYVLGLGYDLDVPLMEKIAKDSGGQYRHLGDASELVSIYNEIAVAIAGGETILNVMQRMFQGQTIQQVVQIADGMFRAMIGVFWGNSMVDVTLIAPDGTVIDPSTVRPDVYHAKGLTYQMYQITNPLPGQWTIIMYGADLPPEGRDVTLQVSVVGPAAPTPSTYKFEYNIPDEIIVATDVDIDVSFMTDEEKDIGYDGVRFRFEADGPGDVTFTATDSEGVEHTFLNSGHWGPDSGFDLPASYNATTSWTLNFLHKAGDYTITFSLIEAPDGDVIADITETVTVTVKPLPAAVTIDPETLNLQAPAKWITAYIELPEEYAAEDIDVGTVQLIYDGSELYADWGDIQDGVFMAKFDWATVAGWFEGLHDVEVELTVAGEVNGVDFEGIDTIRVIDPPRRRGRG